MAFTLGNRSVTKVGIVGSGQIGPDIALHMTKVLQPAGVPVVVVDVSDDALASGEKKLHKKIDRGAEGGAFKPEFAQAMKDNTTFTSDYDALRGADFVIEAASEDLDLKRRIFAQLEGLCAENGILASNSSHLEPELIFAECKNQSRTCVLHYFFPAERNVLVEVVPSAQSDDGAMNWLLDFYEEVGKVPIKVSSRYGYAIDPIFEGMFQAACLCVEEGLGTVKEVDAIARKALRLGIGPFTAMNLTGGNPLTAHGLDMMHDRINPWFKTPQLMKDAIASGEPWDGQKRGEKVDVDPERAQAITDRMQGAYLGLVAEVLDSGITNVADFEMGIEIGLVMGPPFRLMNKLGVARTLELVRGYHEVHPTFPVAKCLERSEPWDIPVVLREDVDGIAVLTIRRPGVLNALNKDVFEQIGKHIADIGADDAVQGAVITGFGKKAFVSGADISMLAAVKTPEDGEATSQHSHGVLNAIESCSKPVVCAYNGLAFGGGNELALACHARIARKGIKILAGQPEPNLGIIPGAGATQRLPRVIGFAKAWSLLRTGGVIFGSDAVESGLVTSETDGDLRGEAVALAKSMAGNGFTRINRDPIPVPEQLPEVSLGHLSTAVDAIMQKAIAEGAAMGLDEGLKFESRCFGEVCGLEDMRIGMENFKTNGPRAKAEFKNR